MKTLIRFLLIASSLATPLAALGDGLQYVEEMDFIPSALIADTWEFKCDVAAPMIAAWQQSYGKITPDLDRATIVAISRWAQEEMENNFSLNPDPMAQPESAYCNEQYFMTDTTIQTLPSHSESVVRWLKVFAVFERETGTPVETFVTIRGERQE